MIIRLCLGAVILCSLNLVVDVRDGFGIGVLKASPRVCIVGAGYSGLGTARYMKEYGVNFTVFEATKHVGGTWRFDPHVGTDEDGLPVFTSMYKNLRINSPRLTMEYTGYPFPEDTQSYPTGECFYKYLKQFAKEFDLLRYIQRYVTKIKWAKGHWDLTYMKVDTKERYTEECDFVVIANGEYSSPVLPTFKGQESFKGNIIHSHDYKDPESYRDRRVLLVGSGPSGIDLAFQLCKVASTLVHSHHLHYTQPFFSEAYIKKPDIKMFTSNGVIFKDNSFEEVQDVILCTGYKLTYPFLDKSSGVTTSGKFVFPLYQHTINIKRPSMAFVGLPKKGVNKVFEAQGEYVAALTAGKFRLPSQQQMMNTWNAHARNLKSNGMKIDDINVIGSDMDAFFANLSAEAGIYRRSPVLTDIRDYHAKYRLQQVAIYRDFDYKIIDDFHYEKKYNPRPENLCPFDDSEDFSLRRR